MDMSLKWVQIHTVTRQDLPGVPMSSVSRLSGSVCAGTLLLLATAAQASLLGRLETSPGSGVYQAYYDTITDVTFLANANLADNLSFGVAGIGSTGGMLWPAANNYIAAMNAYDGGNGYLGFNTWRLPNMDRNLDHAVVRCNPVYNQPGCEDNELGYLFWGDGITNSSQSPFSNIEGQQYFSSTTTYIYVNSLIGWVITNPEQLWVLNFYATDGANYTLQKNGAVGGFVWPVISGDVAAVPAPGAAWLLATGLLAMVGRFRKG